MDVFICALECNRCDTIRKLYLFDSQLCSHQPHSLSSITVFSKMYCALQEKERVQKVVEENEKLLEEKRVLLLKISEAEEMGSNGMRAASTAQHRYRTESVFLGKVEKKC